MQPRAEAPAYSNIALARDLWRFLKPNAGVFTFVTLSRLAGDIARLYPPLAVAGIISYLGKYQAGAGMPLTPVWQAIALAGLTYALFITCRQTAKIVGFRLAERLALDAQLETLRHLFLLDMSWHERENSGNKLKRMQKGGDSIAIILRMWLNSFIEVSVNFVGITVILASFEPRLALAMLGFMAVYLLLSGFFTRRASALSHVVNVQEEELSGLAFEAVNNIRSVKVLGMSAPLQDRMEKKSDLVMSDIGKRVFWYQSRDWVMVMYGNAFSLTVIGFLAAGIAAGRYEIGLLVLFIDYFRKMWENIEELARVVLDFVIAKFSVMRMTELLREPVGIDSEKGKLPFPADWKDIELRDVSFGYGEDRDVLRGVSFTIRKGERIGIVGASGAGKSTLFKLLLKEQEGYQGEVLVGGVPLKDVSRTSYFRHSAVVLQDTEVFNFTLRENITLARPDAAADTALLDRAVATAHVADFLGRLPQGLETAIGEKGIRLSGGEKQRVGIARAVFKQPEILFLDEATSHLDVESEEKIRDSLHTFFQTVTAVVIAHRLSTIKEMDRILVLEDGRIVEQGTFDQLHAKNGRFRELWDKQKF